MPAEVAQWIEGTDVSSDPRVSKVNLPSGITYDQVAQAATDILFELSGRRYTGVTTDTIRPHKLYDRCQCSFAGWSGGYGEGLGGIGARIFPEGWPCTCSTPAEYTMPNGPVVNISEVLVDGNPLVEGVDYALYDQLRLVRLVSPNTGATYWWYCCQLLSYDTSQPGTWSITYSHGIPPTQAAILAVRELTIDYALTIGGGQSKIPAKVTHMSRQGVQIDVENRQALEAGQTGIPLVDAFIHAVNPSGARGRMQIYSPDLIDGARQ